MNSDTLRHALLAHACGARASTVLVADARAQTTFAEVGADAGLSEPVGSWSPSWVDFDGDGALAPFVVEATGAEGPHTRAP